MLNQYLDKLERRFGKFAIPNLMSIILVGMVVIYCFDILIEFNPDAVANVSSLFCFDLDAIRAGQIWRIVTFVFLPPSVGILFAAFEFYFIWLFGRGLEAKWGSFKFNIYFLIGMIGNLIVGLFTGYADNTDLILSLFLAFAILYPDFEVYIFFIIPVKMKWLGILDGILLVLSFIFGGWARRFLILVSIANLLLFFGGQFFSGIYYWFRRKYYHYKNKRR